ncbi:MAG: hypothetical protein M0D57_21150 [Sphingobacteriales bacterium JAD_PAG50586_3]|nr:MAG: hypothetical protein M0D57_21150 [Sphingobacteriales bacterium JAD_PAG50586_3]
MKKAKNSIKERSRRISPEIKLMVTRSREIAMNIYALLEKQGKTQKDLADSLGKKSRKSASGYKALTILQLKQFQKLKLF